MSWLFSRALVEEFSAATCSAGARSALSSASPTPQAFLPNDKMTAFSRPSRSGMTFAPLTDDLGADLLTWFLGDSRVRTYQLPGMAPALTESVPDFGAKWHESSVRYDLDSSSWKTHRCLWEEDLPWSLVTLPSWGMTLGGVLWEPPTLGRPISGTASGSWPTPKANDGEKRGNFDVNNPRNGLPAAAKKFPTPLASDWKRNGSPGDHNRKSPPLGAVVQKWPTPNASDADKWSNQSLADRRARGQQVRLNTAVSPQGGAGGQLNPTWVEWLMGWPLGWTDLKPLEMDRFQEWQQQHSLISHKAGSEAA